MVLFLIKGNYKDSDKLILRAFKEYEKLIKDTNIDKSFLPYRTVEVYRDEPKPKLIFNNNNKVYFSLSHTDGYTFIGFSDEEIGVDIEKNKKRDIKNLKKRVCSNEEYNQIKDLKSFFDIWTKKEAYIKYCGRVKEKMLKEINTLELPIKACNLNLLQNYSMAVCSKQNDMLIRVLTLC